MNPLQIRYGLLETHRQTIADLLWGAFAEKLRPFLGKGQGARRILAESLAPERLVLALEAGQVVGLAIVDTDGGRVLRPSLPRLAAEHGPLGGFWRWLGLRAFSSDPDGPSAHIGALAVAAEARGRGVGTALLAEVEAVARRRGRPRLSLDVVDTNPRARALYERLGFTVTGSLRLPWLFRPFGFNGYDRMVKVLSKRP
jgi:ribosomal protein S18 acetylase RimI-like enzyme